MKYILSILILLALSAPNAVFGFDLKKKSNDVVFDYTVWRDTARVTEAENGRILFYPSTSGDEVSVSGETQVKGLSAQKIFLAALSYAVDHLDTAEEHEEIGEINPDDKSFMIRQFSRQGTNNNETTFTRLTLVKAGEGKILFRSTDIDVRYREKGLIPRTVAFEKLNPATNGRHRELVEQYADICSKYIYDMASAIAGSESLEATHWKEIAEKKVVKGMNMFEVKLILGNPVSERDNGDRIRWIYPKNYILLFVDGRLSRILD